MAIDPKSRIIPLHKMTPGQDADCFVILASKQALQTREGKHYIRIVFRDLYRDAVCMIWADSIFFKECRDSWQVGRFYKIRAFYRENAYGSRLELNRVREVTDADRMDGFDPDECRPGSRIPAELLMEEILTLARTHIVPRGPLLLLVQRIFKDKRKELLETPASRVHHHAYPGGLMEHTLSVVKLAISQVDHFQSYYPNRRKDISKGLVVAGAILHDVGKILEMEPFPIMPRHTARGELIGHYILGRDLICQYGPLVELDQETQLRLEHIILSHSRFPDWGTPKTPLSLEALIVHYADYAESTFSSALRITEFEDADVEGRSPSGFTSRPGPFGEPLYKGNEIQ